MSIGYQFSPVPQELRNKIDFTFKGNKRCVLNRIVNEIFLFPETRETLTKELAYSFLGKKLNLHKSTIGRIIKYFEKIGVIEILQKGKKKVGSLVKLCTEKINDLYNSVKISCTTATNNKSEKIKGKGQLVAPCCNQKERISCNILQPNKVNGLQHGETKQEPSLQELTKQEPNLPTPVPTQLVSSYKDTVKEKTVNRNNFTGIGNILTPTISRIQNSKEKSQPLTDTFSKNLKGPEVDTTIKGDISPELRQAQAMLEQKRAQVKKNNIQVSIPGITEKTLQVGIAKLKSRNITNIPFALEEIKSQMELQEEIKSPKAYFLSLCKKMKNFSKPVVKTAATSTKTMETINSWKEEKEKEEDPNIAFKRFTRENPEGMKEAVQAVNSSPGSRFVSGAIKLILYITEYKKRFSVRTS